YNRHQADLVVGEVNYGGSMVGEVLRTAVADGGLPINFREVVASKSKHVRAEPIATLWSQNRVCLCGRFTELEGQMLAMTTAGYRGDRSPDRLDAMVWSLATLSPAMARSAREDAAGPDAPGRRGRTPRVINSQEAMRRKLGVYGRYR